MSCNLQAEVSETGRGLGRFRSFFFFFLYFRKKLRARATRNKENNNSGLIGEDHTLLTRDMALHKYRRIPLASPGLIHAHFSDLVGLYTGWAYKRVGLYSGIK